MSTDTEETSLLGRFRDAIDIMEILRAIWRQKLIVLATLALCVLACIGYLHVVKPQYTATLQLTAVDDQSKPMRGGLSELANVAGIALPGGLGAGKTDNFELFMQNIYGRETASDLAKDQAILQELFPTQWDGEAKEWREPSGIIHAIGGPIKSLLGIPQPAWHPPGGLEVQQFIQKRVRISRDLRNPIVTLEMDHPDPDFAIRFLTRLQQVDDGRLRRRAEDRTSKYIDYLNMELGKVTNDDYRKALIDLLSDQEKSRMFASSPTIAFAAEPFEAATTSSLPTSPNPVLLIILSLSIGILLGGFLAYFWDSVGPGRERRMAALHGA